MGKDFVHYRVFRVGKAQFRTRETERRFVQNTNNKLFTVNRRQAGHTEVVFLAADVHVDTSVLWHAAFGNVKSADNLDTGADCRVTFDRKFRAKLQVAVDTVAHAHLLFKRFDVNVACAVGDGFADYAVNKAHRRVVDYVVLFADTAEFAVVFDKVFVLFGVEVGQRGGRTDYRHDTVNVPVDLRGRHHYEVQRTHKHRRHGGNGAHVQRSAHGEKQRSLFVAANGHDFVLFHKVETEFVKQFLVDVQHVQFHRGNAEKFRHGVQRGNFVAVFLGDKVLFDGHVEPFAGFHYFVDVLAFDYFFVNEKLQ